jgi:hypothetical protein
VGTDDQTMPPPAEQPESDEFATMRARDLLLLVVRRQQAIAGEVASLRADLSLVVGEMQAQGQRLTLSELRHDRRHETIPPPAPGAADL